jgi:hypothetical protein
MSPPNEPPGTGDIAVASEDVFDTFASQMESSNTSFQEVAGGAVKSARNMAGQMNESQTLVDQLTQAAELRVAYIEATRNGIVGYQSALMAIGAQHDKLGAVTTAAMQRIMTVQSSTDGDN